MKFTLILIAFAAVFVSQGEAAISDALYSLRDSVSETLKSLEEFRGSYKENSQQKITDDQEYKKKQVYDAANNVLTEFRKQVEDAKNGGKDVDECYENLKIKVEAAQERDLVEVNACYDINDPNYASIDRLIDSVVTRGEAILERVKEIDQDCKSTSSFASQSCIFIRLPAVSASVAYFKITAGQIPSTANTVLDVAVGRISRCLQDPLLDYRHALRLIKSNGEECLDEAEQQEVVTEAEPSNEATPSTSNENIIPDHETEAEPEVDSALESRVDESNESDQGVVPETPETVTEGNEVVPEHSDEHENVSENSNEHNEVPEPSNGQAEQSNEHQEVPEHSNEQLPEQSNQHEKLPENSEEHEQAPEHSNEHELIPEQSNEHEEVPEHSNEQALVSEHSGEHEQVPEQSNQHEQLSEEADEHEHAAEKSNDGESQVELRSEEKNDQ